ncbi:MAG: sensor domain-containing diguanylate cyclase/phosphohydrolase [Clostridium sp.]
MFDSLSTLILDALPYAIWVTDVDGIYIYANDFFCKDARVSKEKVIGNSSENLFGKKDSNDFKNRDNIVLSKNEAQGFIVKYNNRVVQQYKKPLYFDGELVGILGSFIDITDSYNSAMENENNKNLLQTIFDNIPDFIFFKDTNGYYKGCNKAFSENILNIFSDSLEGKTDYDLHPKDIAESFIEADKRIMETRQKETVHISVPTPQGDTIYMENVKAPILGDDDTVKGIVGISRNINYRKQFEEELYRLSYTDNLTGLYNRTYFIDRIEKLFKKEYLPLSIIMGDINGLKIINDSLGHLEGDQLLSKISNIILSSTRKCDYVFRWGGDEIIILMPNSNEHVCQNLIDKIYKKCEAYPSQKIPLSIALGSSVITSLNTNIDDALKIAEDKVYRNKLLQTKSFRSSVIDSLLRSLMEKSEETEQHTERLNEYAVKVGKVLGLQSWELDELSLVCNLHDIGKIGIPEEILKKPGKLTNEEYEIMKQHCEKGYRITQSIPELTHISRAVLAHHERYDGKGYPLGLSGENIPLISRIVTVVDSYDAMTNDRCYRKGMSKKEASDELLRNAGLQFDPNVVDIFLSVI